MLVAVAALLASAGITVAAADRADATLYYGCWSYGMPSTTFRVSYVNVNSTWDGFFDVSRARWNNAGVGASITQASSVPAKMHASSYSDSWYGYYIRTVFGGAFDIYINTRTISAKAPSGYYTTWVKSTATHELGHALSLYDNPYDESANGSLMNHNRNRSTVGSPTLYDKANVKACY